MSFRKFTHVQPHSTLSAKQLLEQAKSASADMASALQNSSTVTTGSPAAHVAATTTRASRRVKVAFRPEEPPGIRAGTHAAIKDGVKCLKAYAKVDNFKILCIKATNGDFTAPKWHYCYDIMQDTRRGGSLTNRESFAGGIFYHLHKRMMMNNWIVVIKAQTVFHFLFRDGAPEFVEQVVTSHRSRFNMESLTSGMSEIGHIDFIKLYGAYLEQWLTMKAKIDFPSHEGTPWLPETSNKTFLCGMAQIMDTVEALLAVPMGRAIKSTHVADVAFTLMRADMVLFWLTLTDALFRLVNGFHNLETSDCVTAVALYNRFDTLLERSQPYIERAFSTSTPWEVEFYAYGDSTCDDNLHGLSMVSQEMTNFLTRQGNNVSR